MKIKELSLFTAILSISLMLSSSTLAKGKNQTDTASVLKKMHEVADWQLAHPRNHSKLDWHYGAFYTGIWALYETTGEKRYEIAIRKVGRENDWQLLNDYFMADRLTIAQSYLDMYLKEKAPQMKYNVQWVLDQYLKRKAKANVHWKGNPDRGKWWSWCDALYMAPPVFARMYAATGDIKYLDYMNKHWWITSDYLYDQNEHLFYRDDRFFDKRTENGEKVFWSRGNGWVMGGLVRILEYMPEDYPTRSKFIKQYKEMAQKIASIQGDDGLWRSSLLDPEEYPVGESSGSAFFCYALTWGINHGILDKDKYRPVVMKAWNALSDNVNDAGRLGYVQQVGDSPKAITADQSEVYGSGAYLLAGSEIYKFLKKEDSETR